MITKKGNFFFFKKHNERKLDGGDENVSFNITQKSPSIIYNIYIYIYITLFILVFLDIHMSLHFFLLDFLWFIYIRLFVFCTTLTHLE